MTRRRSSLGFLGVFGRSEDLRALDAALRAADLHPRLVPEAVKLATVHLVEDRAGSPEAALAAIPAAAELLAYGMLGPDLFERANGTERLSRAEARIEAALALGTGLDAQLILLTMQARLIQPAVVERFGLEADGA